MSEEEKIKPCPFCGSKEVELCRTNEYACWIRCTNDECGIDGPADAKRITAIFKWNSRTQTTGLAELIEDDEA